MSSVNFYTIRQTLTWCQRVFNVGYQHCFVLLIVGAVVQGLLFRCVALELFTCWRALACVLYPMPPNWCPLNYTRMKSFKQLFQISRINQYKDLIGDVPDGVSGHNLLYAGSIHHTHSIGFLWRLRPMLNQSNYTNWTCCFGLLWGQTVGVFSCVGAVFVGVTYS